MVHPWQDVVKRWCNGGEMWSIRGKPWPLESLALRNYGRSVIGVVALTVANIEVVSASSAVGNLRNLRLG